MRDLEFEIKGLLPEDIYFSVKDELKITDDLDREVDEASARYAFYALLAEKAETMYQKLKFRSEGWRAEVESTESSRRFSENLKSATEAQMKAFVCPQPKYRQYQVKLIEYDDKRRVQKILARAFEMKKDLIQTKCSNRRTEAKMPRTTMD